MKTVAKSLITAAGMALVLAWGSASAQTCDPKDPKCEPPPPCDPKTEICDGGGEPCSPGFYKNHLTYWVGIYCTDVSDPTCTELLDALTCRGSDASCGRSVAAAYLNNLTGCTE